MPSFQKISIASRNSILLEKELWRLHCGCYGNKVTIAMWYVAVPIVSRNVLTKYELNRT